VAGATAHPRVWLVGGSDVDARIDLMQALRDEFEIGAVGSDPRLVARFEAADLRYRSYRMSRGVSPMDDLWGLWQLVRLFRASRPEIVHTFDTKPCVWGRLAARLAGVPVIIGTLPGLGSLYSTGGWKSRLVRLPYQALQTAACRLSDRTTFQNQDDAREFVRRRVVSRRRTTVIRGSGVRTDLLVPGPAGDDAAYRRELGLPDEGLVFLTVTRVLRSKGVLELAHAARTVRDVDPSIQFVLAGPADQESMESLTAAELEELEDSVRWIGARSDVKRLLELADAFVFPSFYREGIPRALLEAASMAMPLIAADVAGSREVVSDGVNGFLLRPRDAGAIAEAVLRLAREPDLRARFGAESRRRALAEFDLAVIARDTAALYRALLPPVRS
jgi:glycosyltransferase involved in cell wall biosynthesis